MSSIMRLIRLPLDSIRAAIRFTAVVLGALLEQLRAGQDRVQRIAQVVAEHRREHLVEAQRLGPVAAARCASCCFCRYSWKNTSALFCRMCGSIGL